MLSISSGHSAEYLTGQVAQGRESYYLDATTAGEPPGRWWGAGAEALGLSGEVDHDVMAALYGEFRDPRDPAFADPDTRHRAARLGRAPGRYKSEEQLVAEALAREPSALPERVREIELDARKRARQPVQFLDATFSPVKSFTVLHTALHRAELDAERAGDDNARAVWAGMRADVEAALWAGNQTMLSVLAARAGFSRAGRHGAGAGRWVDAHDWTVASFHQSDNRDHDPQQHIHNAILNRVVCSDGEVRTLDSRAVHTWKQAAGALGERVMEEELSRRLGVEWVLRADGQAREIAGIDEAVMDLFSERAAHISRGLAERVRAFEQAHGRAPSALELTRMRQQLALGTRRAKTHAGETHAARLDRWDEQLRAEVAGGLASVAGAFRAKAIAGEAPAATPFSPSGVISEAVAACQEKRAAFTRSELERQISLRLPALGGLDAHGVTELVSGLADQAMQELVPVTGQQPAADELPDDLTLSNGQSVYAAPGAVRYATREHIVAEQALRRAAIDRGRAAVSAERAARWLAARADAVSGDQAAAVRGILTSGAAVSVLVGPAGTGKSHTVGVLATGWGELLGGRLVGVATSQIATEVLVDDGVPAMNTTRWLNAQRRLAAGTATEHDQAWHLSARDAVVVDESSMVDTAALAEIRDYVDRAGARLILTGDPRQLAAVGAGGTMDMLTGDGEADVHTLSEVRRFSNDWECDASLALRDGDASAVTAYDRRGRIIDAGTTAQAAHRAADAYLGDTLSGLSSLVVVATNQQATSTAAIIRDKLVELGRVAEDGALVRDGNLAGVGDLVQARRNDWTIGTGLVNRRRYTVTAVREDGGLDVVDATGERYELPPTYVSEHLTLGYAATAHSCQGVTVDTAHVITAPQTTSEGLYVGMSRGRAANTAYVTTIVEQPGEETGETHERDRADPLSSLVDILEQDSDDERAALEQAAIDAAEAGSMHTIAARREDAIRQVTRRRLERHLDQLVDAGILAEPARTHLAADQGTEQLSRLLRAVEQAGLDPLHVLTDAVRVRSLDDAVSPAQVLHHRISAAHRADLAPSIDTNDVPAGVGTDWQRYLAALGEAGADRRRVLGAEAATEPETWALDAFGPVPDDPTDRADWEHRVGLVAAYREATGWADPDEAIGPAPGLSSTERRAAWHEAWATLGRPDITVEERTLSDGALRNRIRAWEREQAWAPADVYDEMRTTGQQAARRRQEAALLDARAEAIDDAAEAAQLREEAEHARALAAVLADVEHGLARVADARAEWVTETAQTAELAARAEAELAARGNPIGAEADQTMPEEWLAAHRAAVLEDDEHRPITELDLAVDQLQGETADDVVRPAVAGSAARYDGPELPEGVPSPVEVSALTSAAAASAAEVAARRDQERRHRDAEASRAQAELDATREHHYRERERAELEADERDRADVLEL